MILFTYLTPVRAPDRSCAPPPPSALFGPPATQHRPSHRVASLARDSFWMARVALSHHPGPEGGKLRRTAAAAATSLQQSAERTFKQSLFAFRRRECSGLEARAQWVTGMGGTIRRHAPIMASRAAARSGRLARLQGGINFGVASLSPPKSGGGGGGAVELAKIWKWLKRNALRTNSSVLHNGGQRGHNRWQRDSSPLPPDRTT